MRIKVFSLAHDAQATHRVPRVRSGHAVPPGGGSYCPIRLCVESVDFDDDLDGFCASGATCCGYYDTVYGSFHERE